jgi:hypothetical protein
MSSPKPAAAKTARRPKAQAQPAVKRAQTAVRPAAEAANGADASAQATRLAADIERALAGGTPDVLSPEALQALMGAVCKTYAAQVEAGSQTLPLPARGGATATDVMVTASGLLKAANLAVFELGMWQSWTGR